MAAILFGFELSPPARAARLMFGQKGIPFEFKALPAGFHPYLLRARGFRGATVPAMRLDDGRRVQGSREIARVLDELVPDPPLLPVDPAHRARVEAAEAWSQETLQMQSRHVFRAAAVRDPQLREWVARDSGLPFPALAGRFGKLSARQMAARSETTLAAAQQVLAELPTELDRADALLADGTIGGDERNIADFQVLTCISSLLSLEVTRPAVEGRPIAAAAAALDPPRDIPVRL